MNMDIKLENLKGSISTICEKIEDKEYHNLTMADIQEELFKLMGDIDEIKEDHEERISSIIELLK